MHADLIRTSLRDSCLGVAPGVHEAWHKNAEKALVPCFAGPAWGVSPAGQDRYGRLGRRHLVMRLETTTLETRPCPCPYIAVSSAVFVP